MPLFATEGGRQVLAQALFDSFKNRIRCPTCPGNKGNPGFTLDSAGKCSKEGRSRRYFSCQLSGGAGSKTGCRRASCSKYIQLASEQLKAAEFADTVRRIQARFEEGSEQHQTLGTYLASGPPHSRLTEGFFKQFHTTSPASSGEADVDKPLTPSSTLSSTPPLSSGAPKRKAESPPADIPSDHAEKRLCDRDYRASVRRRSTPIRTQIKPLVDQLSTVLTTICEMLEIVQPEPQATPLTQHTARSCSAAPPSPTVAHITYVEPTLDHKPSALVPPSRLDLDIRRKEFALELATQFSTADNTGKKSLRKQAKAAGVFSYFEDEVQKSNPQHKSGIENRLC
jgi:hypothetical protein